MFSYDFLRCSKDVLQNPMVFYGCPTVTNYWGAITKAEICKVSVLRSRSKVQESQTIYAHKQGRHDDVKTISVHKKSNQIQDLLAKSTWDLIHRPHFSRAFALRSILGVLQGALAAGNNFPLSGQTPQLSTPHGQHPTERSTPATPYGSIGLNTRKL